MLAAVGSAHELVSMWPAHAAPLVPLLETVVNAGKPLFIVAEDVEGEALATLVINRIRGTFKVCAVKAPGYGDRRKAMLEDIAILTGGSALFESLGKKLENVTIADLGRAKKIIIDKDNTTIIEGAGKSAEIKGRIDQLRRVLKVVPDAPRLGTHLVGASIRC